MIVLRNENGLIFCSLNFEIDGQQSFLKNVLIDTGCASTIINSDIIPVNGTEVINFAFGVGGRETILDRTIKNFKINGFTVNKNNINLGEMDYGLDIDCILGFDVLKKLKSIINIDDMTLKFKQE